MRRLLIPIYLLQLLCWLMLWNGASDPQAIILVLFVLVLLGYAPLFIKSFEQFKHSQPRLYNRLEQLKLNGGTHTQEQWLRVKAKQHYRCASCQQTEYQCGPLTKDHIIPLRLGGTDSISNIQALCKSCNSSKGIRIIDYR